MRESFQNDPGSATAQHGNHLGPGDRGRRACQRLVKVLNPEVLGVATAAGQGARATAESGVR